jgi:hypothetical protein
MSPPGVILGVSVWRGKHHTFRIPSVLLLENKQEALERHKVLHLPNAPRRLCMVGTKSR